MGILLRARLLVKQKLFKFPLLDLLHAHGDQVLVCDVAQVLDALHTERDKVRGEAVQHRGRQEDSELVIARGLRGLLNLAATLATHILASCALAALRMRVPPSRFLTLA